MAVTRAAEELDCSVSKISRIETGLSTPRRPEIDTLLRLYEAPDAREELVQLAGEGKQAAWYDAYGDLLAPGSTLHRFIGLEAGASLVRPSPRAQCRACCRPSDTRGPSSRRRSRLCPVRRWSG